jgi:hypothetical protein
MEETSTASVQTIPRISLRAIFAGLAVTVGVLAVCLGISFAIGLSTFHPTADRAFGLALSLFIWSAVAIAIALAAGGYVSALVARCRERRDGVLHGLVVWGTAMALLAREFLSIFVQVMNSLMMETGAGDVAARAGVAARPSLGLAAQMMLAHMARDAGLVLWIFWAAVVMSLLTASLGGWWGTRVERQPPLPRERKVTAPPVVATLPHPA